MGTRRTIGAKPLTLSQQDLRQLARWIAACAVRALPLFEAAAPADSRPRDAIEGVLAFARGGERNAQLRSVAWSALAAAREASDPVVAAAARAAGLAAASAYTHALASPHQNNHILGPVVQAARARELAAGGDPILGDKEIRWALRRATPSARTIVRRFPRRREGRGRLDQLSAQLEEGLRRRSAGARSRTGARRRSSGPHS